MARCASSLTRHFPSTRSATRVSPRSSAAITSSTRSRESWLTVGRYPASKRTGAGPRRFAPARRSRPARLPCARTASRPGRGCRRRAPPPRTGPPPRRVGADSRKGGLRAQVADAADVELVVRRLEHDYEIGLSGLRTGLQELGHRAFLSRELLADEEEKAEVELGLGGERPLGKLEHHGHAALHVARPEADDRIAFYQPRKVVLRGNGVEMAGEQDEGPPRMPLGGREQEILGRPDRRQRQLSAHVGHRFGFRSANRGDVDERQRALGQPPIWLRVGHMRILPREGHNLCVTLRQPDPAPGAQPERGFVVAVLAQGIDADRELAELQELARTAGVELVGELVQRSPKPQPRTYVGKGKLV